MNQSLIAYPTNAVNSSLRYTPERNSEKRKGDEFRVKENNQILQEQQLNMMQNSVHQMSKSHERSNYSPASNQHYQEDYENDLNYLQTSMHIANVNRSRAVNIDEIPIQAPRA